MNVKYFGQYLLENGYINREQLLEGIKYQKVINVKIGVLAIDKEYLTSTQVQKILETQRSENKAFGEIAMENGFLTQQQMDELISLQKADRIFLGESLVEKAFMTLEQLEKYLIEYKKVQAEADSEIHEALNSIHSRFATIVKDGIQITQNLLVRLLDEYGKISACVEKSDDGNQADYMVYQKVFGEKNFIYGLALKSDTLLYMTSKIFKREVQTIDEYAKDGLKEFVNMVVGHICAALSNEGIKTETSPPQCVLFKDFSSDLPEATDIIISLLMTEDEFDVHFLIG